MGSQSQTGAMGTAGSDDQLQQQIQTALKNEPTLANDNINVNIAADKIELTGDVATGKEKKTAKRIAESYAANRKVVDHITVGGKGQGDNSGMGNPTGNPSSPSNTPPSSSGEQQKPPQL